MNIVIVIQIIGIIIALFGVVYLLKPDIAKHIIEFFKKGKRIYFAALLRLALAIVFLLAARECDLTWVIVVFGILFLVGGLLIFALGAERAKSILDWFQKQSDLFIRLMALITLAIGAVIIYSA